MGLLGEGGKGRGACNAVVCMLLRFCCRSRTIATIAMIIAARPTTPPVIALAEPMVCLGIRFWAASGWMVAAVIGNVALAAVIGNVALYDAKMVSRRE